MTATAEPTPKPTGLLAQFAGPEELLAAAARIRDAGYRRWDVHTPFPVHGMERAMGIRPTILPWLVLGAGITGCAAAILMQWWMNAVSYPYVISGKPLFSLPANIPVAFELIVLFSAFAAFGGALVLNRLPQFFHAASTSPRFARATADGFFAFIEAADPKFHAGSTAEFLQTLGAEAVEVCREPLDDRKFPAGLYWVGAFALVLALAPPAWVAWCREVTSDQPRIHPIQDMDFQPRYLPQAESELFADHRAMRPPVPGAIAADVELPTDSVYYRGLLDGKPAPEFPTRVAVTRATAERGRRQFDIYCACCHGAAGDGDGMAHLRAVERGEINWVKPRSLHEPAVRQQPVGQLFKTITEGVATAVKNADGTTSQLNTMPSYAVQVPVEDRWAIVLYIKALQRSRTATLKDVPEELRNELK